MWGARAGGGGRAPPPIGRRWGRSRGGGHRGGVRERGRETQEMRWIDTDMDHMILYLMSYLRVDS